MGLPHMHTIQQDPEDGKLITLYLKIEEKTSTELQLKILKTTSLNLYIFRYCRSVHNLQSLTAKHHSHVGNVIFKMCIFGLLRDEREKNTDYHFVFIVQIDQHQMLF